MSEMSDLISDGNFTFWFKLIGTKIDLWNYPDRNGFSNTAETHTIVGL